MSDEYSLRKDIDKLANELRSNNNKSVLFEDGSNLKGIYSKVDSENNPTNTGTLDAILEQYDTKITMLELRIDDLESRIGELEL